MAFSNLETSERLQRVLGVLLDGEWHSTLEIMLKADAMAVNTCISELRFNGFDIECRQVGHNRFEYRLNMDKASDNDVVNTVVSSIAVQIMEGAEASQVEVYGRD